MLSFLICRFNTINQPSEVTTPDSALVNTQSNMHIAKGSRWAAGHFYQKLDMSGAF